MTARRQRIMREDDRHSFCGNEGDKTMSDKTRDLYSGEKLLFAGLGTALAGILLYCAGDTLAFRFHIPLLTSGTGAGIIAMGVLMWLTGAVSLSLEE